MKSFTESKRELLTSLPACTGDMARLANALSEALTRLDAVTDQAAAQFKVGDRHATFNKEFIRAIREPGMY